MLEFKNGRLRITDYEKDVKRFNLSHNGEQYAYIHVYRGVIIAAGCVEECENHDYYINQPNWDKVIELLRFFHDYDIELFDEVNKCINRKTKEWKFLSDSAKKYISSKISKLNEEIAMYRALYASLD